MKLSGSCLCGSITITGENAAENVGACHCSMCRRWGGGPLMAVNCGTEVSIQPDSMIGIFDSSPWAERGFCKKCGSHLFYRLKASNLHMIPAGIFDGNPNFKFEHQVFIDNKPEYYHFGDKTHDMTEAEVFAKYAPTD